MNNNIHSFSLQELKKISNLIKCAHDENLSLTQFAPVFMAELKKQIYFDKSDFMFFTYDKETDRHQMQSFEPVNWTDFEINHYINIYMHMDDVLPILSQSDYITFRNSDLFSLKERRKTKYFQEFAKSASLEISIDANIPIPEEYNVIAILGLFRNTNKLEFTVKDLEIIKILQPHLSMGIVKRLDNSRKNNSDLSPALDKFETLGVCILDKNMKILSNNVSFARFAENHGESIDNSELTTKIKAFVKKLNKDQTIDKLGPLPIEIEDQTYMVQIAYSDNEQLKTTVVIYCVSDVFTKRLTSLKEEYKLSNREFEILYLMLKKGMTSDQIASELFISPATVKRHLSTAYQKIDINNQKQLLRILKIL
ncbi:MAG: helix-turn-helix transcriptional regulator [Anaerovoracaceae bacterium]